MRVSIATIKNTERFKRSSRRIWLVAATIVQRADGAGDQYSQCWAWSSPYGRYGFVQTRTISFGQTRQAYHFDFSSDADDAQPLKIEDSYQYKSIRLRYNINDKFVFN
jgi:hypothetical protein